MRNRRTRTGGRRTDLARRENRSRVGSRTHGPNPSSRALNANIEAAAEPGPRVNLRGGAWREIGVGDDELCVAAGLRAGAVLAGERLVLTRQRLIAQAELEPVIGGFQARLVERLFELRLLVLQELQRVGAVGGHVRRHLAVAVNIETYVEAPEFRRIEPDFELVGAGLRANSDRDRHSPGTGAFVAAADDAEPDALAGDVAAARAEKPKFGTAVRSVFAAAACVFDVAALVVAEVVGSGAFTAARSLVAAAAASDGARRRRPDRRPGFEPAHRLASDFAVWCC